jgi:8-oxo-dGTP diphosphatase
MYNTQTPFVASYVIVRQDGKIAFLMRSNTPWGNGFYGLPSGKVEKDEGATDAAVHEAKEEIGITIEPTNLTFVHLMHRHLETDWIDIFFETTNYTGKVVNGEPDKHSELAWLDPKNLPDNVLDYIKVAMAHIEAGEFYSEYKWDKN